jgi:hypothetical protein
VKDVSKEFGYTYNPAPLSLTQTTFYEHVDAIFQARPNETRFRPYAVAGPAFQPLRLYDANGDEERAAEVHGERSR